MADGVIPPFAHQAQVGGRQQGKTAAQVLADAMRAGDPQELNYESLFGQFMEREQAESRLHRHRERHPEISKVWIDEAGNLKQHQIDALKYAMQPPPPVIVKQDVKEISDADMVMEMIRRGYAVMKLPADGGPPESLRDG